MADLAAVASAISSYRLGDLDAAARAQETLLSTVSASTNGVSESESLLSCVVESFVRAGEDGKDLLDQLLLELSPHLAPLADLSQSCSQSLSTFFGMAAAACTPRDTITAFLEVMDQLLSESSLGPHALQFLNNLLSLLPQQLSKLPRRKAAFTVECLVPAAALAKIHGEVLQGWMLAQLQLAATPGISAAALDGTKASGSDQAAVGVLQRMDTFLATNWQIYEDFASDALHKVLPQEPDAAAVASCKQAIGNLVLQLLLHLTAAWPLPGMLELTLQTISSPIEAGKLPTAASVQAPSPMTLANAAASLQRGASATQVSRMPSSVHGEHHETGSQTSHAAEVVLSMLQLLQQCQYTSWHDLASKTGKEAAGAALAAVYDTWFHDSNHQGGGFVMPDSPTRTLQLACSWSAALSAASEGNPLTIIKVIALQQITAAHCASLQCPSAAAAVVPGTVQQAGSDQSMAAAAVVAQSLLPHLEPCINVLASAVAAGLGTAFRAQASQALQQLLRAPPQAVSYCCLQALLGSSSRDSDSNSSTRHVHPEVAALLLQEVRQQLANSQGPGPFSSMAAVQLGLPWLQQHGTAGWRDSSNLANNANAVSAALAVVRLALLRQQRGATKVHSAAAGADSTLVDSAAATGSGDDDQQEVAQLRRLLQQPLQQLSAGVADALQALQRCNRAEQSDLQDQAAAAVSSGQQQERRQQQPVRIPGDAQGAGQAVDAWLAVSRVQDVLERVLELLQHYKFGSFLL